MPMMPWRPSSRRKHRNGQERFVVQDRIAESVIEGCRGEHEEFALRRSATALGTLAVFGARQSPPLHPDRSELQNVNRER